MTETENSSKFTIMGRSTFRKYIIAWNDMREKTDLFFLYSKNIANFDHFIKHIKPQISVERYFYENLSQPSIHTAHIPLWFFYNTISLQNWHLGSKSWREFFTSKSTMFNFYFSTDIFSANIIMIHSGMNFSNGLLA